MLQKEVHINDLLAKNQPSISFEFFPPKTIEAADKLFEVVQQLARKKPSFVSVTYGAGGATRDLTHDLVLRILSQTAIPAVPHLTCVLHTRQEIAEILGRYAEAGVSNILALRGDPPLHVSHYRREDDDFPYAGDLVRSIVEFNEKNANANFGIGVAGFPEGHPQTPNRVMEMDHLKAKVDAGADYICTQLFFDNHDLLDFRDRCELAGINIPIIAGVMPVTSRKGMVRMASLAEGARFPAKLQRALLDRPQEDDVTAVGIDYATAQCEELLREGIPGIHFYTLNKSRATLEVMERLAL